MARKTTTTNTPTKTKVITTDKERNRRPIKWEDENKRKVLALVFEGRYSQARIAEQCGISLRTCEDWISHPDFKAKLAEMRVDILKSCDDIGVAYLRKEQRLIALAQMAESARSEYLDKTWVQEERPSPNGSVINESYNDAAFGCFRGAMDDIAKELGHRKQVMAHEGKDGADLPGLTIITVPVSDEVAARYIRKVTPKSIDEVVPEM